MASASAIRAGAAYVELFTKDNLLVSGLRAAEARIKAFGASITALGTRFALLGGAIALPMFGAAKVFADSGSELLLMSQRTGLSVEALSQLKFAAAQAGVSAEDLETGFIRMSRAIGSGGVPLDQRFADVAAEIANIQDPAQRTARAIEVFGRGGASLLPLLLRGRDGIAALREEANRLGLTKDLEHAMQAHELQVALNNAAGAGKAVVTTLGGVLAPMLTAAARHVLTFVGAIRGWIKDNRQVFQTVFAISAAVLGLGTALILVGKAISFVGSALGVLTGLVSFAFTTASVAVGLLASALTFLISPIGLVLAALGGLVAAILTGTSQGRNALSALGTGFQSLGTTARTAWGAIGDAIATGDWAGAMNIAWLGVQVVWRTAIATLSSAWRSFTGFFIEGWHTAVSAVSQIILTLAKFATGVISGILEGLVTISGTIGLDIQNPLAGIAENLEAVQANMTQQDAAEEARRRREREAANAADQAEIARLQDQIGAAADAAAIRRAISEDIAGLFGAGGPEEAVLAAGGKATVHGTFSAAAAVGLGASSVTERIATATEQTARNTGNIAQPAFT